MVNLTEVPDEQLQVSVRGKKNGDPFFKDDDDDEDFEDTDSEISAESEFDERNETLAVRLWALRDMVPATTRGWAWSRVTSAGGALRSTLSFCARAAWAVSVTTVLVVAPFVSAYNEEQNIVAQEQEQRMREIGGDLVMGGTADADAEKGVDGVGAAAARASAAL